MSELYKTRTKQLIVIPKTASIFSESATTIGIDDEGAGEFITITQTGLGVDVRLDIKEWEYVKKVVDKLITEIKENEIATPTKQEEQP